MLRVGEVMMWVGMGEGARRRMISQCVMGCCLSCLCGSVGMVVYIVCCGRVGEV